jgi:hypothetical protein
MDEDSDGEKVGKTNGKHKKRRSIKKEEPKNVDSDHINISKT